MHVDPAMRAQLLAEIPSLRAYARSLTHDAVYADDLVQETLIKAWSKMDHFERGTNLPAWLFTILRYTFYSNNRKKRREVEDADGEYASRLAVNPEQGGHLDFTDFQIALGKLCPEQREALLLVAAQGFSYEEAAGICGVLIGTVKSRVSRARVRLAQLLSIEHMEDIGPDRMTMAALRWQPQSIHVPR
jgi:RNA polymerase sigma-70 factor (ECF subfamily)